MAQIEIMTSESATPTQSWLVESIRLTAFPLPGASLDTSQETWLALVGEQPESVETNPRQNLGTASGRWEADSSPVNLAISVSSGRIDLRITPYIDLDSPMDHIPSIGEPAPTVDAFRSLAVRWLEHAPSIKRLAVAPTLVREAVSVEEGYRLLGSTLPAGFDPSDYFDFNLQLNRKTNSSAIPGLELNRLVKWSLGTLQEFVILGSGGLGKTVQQQSRTIARIDMDINTAAEQEDELPKSSMPDLLSELIDFALEISYHGLGHADD